MEQGCFASYQVDPSDPRYGWKQYPVADFQTEEGSRVHAYTEVTILQFLKELPEFDETISKLAEYAMYGLQVL